MKQKATREGNHYGFGMGQDAIDGSDIIWAKDVPPPGKGEEIKNLWGPFLYPSSLHLLAGDAGIGKTTFAYNLAVRLAQGEPFVGFQSSRPLKILYYDLETPDLLFKAKLHRVSKSKPPANLAFSRYFDAKSAMKLVKEHGFDLLIIDTGNQAFDTHEEENNAEANRQMFQLRNIILNTGVAILVFYHMAKDHSAKGVYKLRGASARPAAADVVINLLSQGESADSWDFAEIIKFDVPKNRWSGDKTTLWLKKTGEDCFDVANESERHSETQESLAKDLILECLNAALDVTETSKIIQFCNGRGIPKPTVERALSLLVKDKEIERPRKGFYCLSSIHQSSEGTVLELVDGNGTRRHVDRSKSIRVKKDAA